MRLQEFVEEILAIARENRVSWDVGLDMFLNNVQDAGREEDPYVYRGADQVDYAGLRRRWEALTPLQRAKAREEFVRWYRAGGRMAGQTPGGEEAVVPDA